MPSGGFGALVQSLSGLDCKRIFNCCDLVARVPPSFLGYVHTPHPTFIGWDANLHEDPSDAVVDSERHLGRGDFFSHYAARFGNVPTRDLADHAPVNYLRAYFP